MSVSYIPDGYHTATSYLIVDNAEAAIDYYKQCFGAIETMRLTMPDGSIAHAEFRIGDSNFMISNAQPEQGFSSPKQLGGTPVQTLLYMPNVDSVFQRAVDLGGTELRPVQDQFYGDRSGSLADPFGQHWTIATHIEDVNAAEGQSRLDKMMQQS